MPKTISFHNGTSWSRGHNARDKRYTSKQEHIDPELSKNNVTMRDVSARDAYREIFGEAVEEYNARQKRSDRKIDNYYDKIKADKRKHTVYEAIVQIGDSKDTGNNAKQETLALERFITEWDKRNPNLHLIGAYIHADEPNGTVHAHLDYIPVAECTRGLRLQNSYDKALQQQGFKTENIHQTAQIAWQNREREALCSICRELNIDVQHNQGISDGREHLSKQEYIRAKEAQQAELDKELQPLKEELSEYRELKVSADEIEPKKKAIPLSNRTAITTTDLDILENQAKAYRVNRQEIDTLREREKGLKSRAALLDSKAQDLEQRELEVLRQKHEQFNLNAYYGIAKRQATERGERIEALEAENASLRNEIQKRDETIQKLEKSLREATEAFRGAYKTVAGIVKAVSTLVYSHGVLKASLTAQQTMLVDSVREYAEYWAKKDGFDDIADDIKQHYGLTKGVRGFLEERIKRENGRVEQKQTQSKAKSRGMERG